MAVGVGEWLPLEYYFPKQTDSRWVIRNHGETVASSSTKIVDARENVEISGAFTHPALEGSTLHVAIQRSALVETLDEARRKTVAAALIGLALILAMAHYLSRYFADPLNTMSGLMKRIVRDRRYDLRSEIRRGDEIGFLSENIDTLLQTTQELLVTLEMESKSRLKRFIGLTEIFNAITRSDEEGEIDRLVKKCLSDDYYEKDLAQYERFIEAVSRMARLQKERLLLQKTQLRLLEEASSALKTKNEFISQISHEFRTPLNSIIGFSQFMDQEKLLAEPYDTLPGKVEKAGKHLLGMINQLLELAKSKSASPQREIKPVEMAGLLEEVAELVMPLAQKNRTTLTVTTGPGPFVVEADLGMLRQVLFNLVGNAIKFSPDATVDVALEVREEGVVVATVRDTGIGMEKGEIDRLFTPFQRLSNSREFKGTGLGLSLAKAYVESFGGTIAAASDGPGEGSAFTIRLPKAKEEPCVS